MSAQAGDEEDHPPTPPLDVREGQWKSQVQLRSPMIFSTLIAFFCMVFVSSGNHSLPVGLMDSPEPHERRPPRRMEHVQHRQLYDSSRKLSSKMSSDTTNQRVLNVHVVPHTHDDVGWLKTVEQYYFGWNETIQRIACVQDILDTVVSALLENESRTFTYVESKFFSMWWTRQNDAVKDEVRYLVANQQLSFANGGWCMHGKNYWYEVPSNNADQTEAQNYFTIDSS